jgi:hypothetical protein
MPCEEADHHHLDYNIKSGLLTTNTKDEKDDREERKQNNKEKVKEDMETL